MGQLGSQKLPHVFITALSVGQPASGLCKCQLVTTCAPQKADVKAGQGSRAQAPRPPRGSAHTGRAPVTVLFPWPLARELKDMGSDTSHQDRSDVKTEATQGSATGCRTLPL